MARRYTDAKIKLHVDSSMPLANMGNALITFAQGSKHDKRIIAEFRFDADEVTLDTVNNTVSVQLTQEQTARFDISEKAKVQISYFISGKRKATKIAQFSVNGILHEQVLTDE